MKDNVRRYFTQSFFLATQDEGYFVLSDSFRYIEEDHYVLLSRNGNGNGKGKSEEKLANNGMNDDEMVDFIVDTEEDFDEKGVVVKKKFDSATKTTRSGGEKQLELPVRIAKGGFTMGNIDISKLVMMIMECKFQPFIIFSFSRRECEQHALSMSKLDFNSEEEKGIVEEVFKKAIMCLPEEDRKLPPIELIFPLLQLGVVVHHSGILPIIKELEEYFSTGDVYLAASDLRNLDSGEHPYYFVRKLIFAAMNMNDKRKKMASVMLLAFFSDATLRYVCGNHAKATPLLEEIIWLALCSPDAYYMLGLIYDANGDRKRGLNSHMIVAHLRPKDPYIWKKLVVWSMEQKTTCGVTMLLLILIFSTVHRGMTSLRDVGEKLIGERAYRLYLQGFHYLW